MNKYEVVTMSDVYKVEKIEYVDFYDALKLYEDVSKDDSIIKCKLQVLSKTILFEQERGE